MDLVVARYQIVGSHLHQSQLLETPPSTAVGSHLHQSNTSFPILAVAIIGIFATALLLVGYYVFVIKCCLDWHRIDLLSRFSVSRNRRTRDPIGLYSPRIERRGLDESVIQSIPIFQFRGGKGVFTERSFNECSVCLNDFQEDEKLRAIPNCNHLFHVDCIDVWLQSNVNCPLCRTSISTSRVPVAAPRFSPENPHPITEDFLGRDDDFVVIELGGVNYSSDQTLLRGQERLKPISPSPRKTVLLKKVKKLKHVSSSSMGDECIDIREKDDQFDIQPIRRSFSMDSTNDRKLYSAVQEIVQQNSHFSEVCFSEGCSSVRVMRRSFFSFANGRASSRSAVLPLELDPL